ncbi:MAG TPA: hypothetical protein PK048_01925 [Candidatus Absconditabacterales bacterium]|nr:hypothetical protein [Candidatus Absconditabacterales bacterium]
MKEKGITFTKLDITLPQFIVTAYNNKNIGNGLFTLLSEIDTKIGNSSDNTMRLEMIQNGVAEGIKELEVGIFSDKPLNDHIIKLALISKIECIIAMEMGYEGGEYKEKGFNYVENKKDYVEYKSLNIQESFGVLRRGEMCFVDQPGINDTTIHAQSFIEWSNEKQSIEFAKEYYKYCCNPSNYPGSKIRYEDIGSHERFPITSNVLKHMEKNLGISFSELKIYKFFNTEYKDHIMPTHALLCHMFLMCSGAEVPFYLAGGHLGDPDKYDDQFEYYSQFLIHNDEYVIPNKQGFIKLLKILITILKSKKEYGSRLCQQVISIDELSPLMKAQNIGPFELYEGLIREQFCLVDNITTGDTIGFKLTGTGMMFLYMCCPKI